MPEKNPNCGACGAELKRGEWHLCLSAKDNEPRTPFHGKPNEPITFADHEIPKV